MGMSASQARLLSITSRMNDIEFKSQSISNTKIRLADESEQVANAYTKALNKQKFTYTDYSSGQAQKVDLNSSTLAMYGLRLVARNTTPSYRVLNSNYLVVQSFKNRTDLNKYINQNNTTLTAVESSAKKSSTFVATSALTAKLTTFNNSLLATQATHAEVLQSEQPELTVSGARNTGIAANNFSNFIERENNLVKPVLVDLSNSANAFTFAQTEIGGARYFIQEISTGVPTTFTSSELYEMIESGQFYLEGAVTTTTADGVSVSGTGEISVSSTTALAIESDSSELAKAEAEYNASTAKINKKEKLLDNDLKALDTEHQALKTEQDSIKSLIKDNVDKTFNLFS